MSLLVYFQIKYGYCQDNVQLVKAYGKMFHNSLHSDKAINLFSLAIRVAFEKLKINWGVWASLQIINFKMQLLYLSSMDIWGHLQSFSGWFF